LAFAIAMVLFSLAVFGIGFYAIANGTPFKIIAPINDYGVMCGYGQTSNYPFKFYPYLKSQNKAGKA
jgi:hypothetical protein